MRLEEMSRKALDAYINKLSSAILFETDERNLKIYTKWLDEARAESERRITARKHYVDYILNKKHPKF